MKHTTVLLALCCLVGLVVAQQKTPPAKGDFRSEFDHLLIIAQQERLGQLEHQLLQIARGVAHLEETKTKAEQDHVIVEIDAILAFALSSQEFLHRELQRTDLNILERFHFESTLATTEILVKDLKTLETRVRLIKTTA